MVVNIGATTKMLAFMRVAAERNRGREVQAETAAAGRPPAQDERDRTAARPAHHTRRGFRNPEALPRAGLDVTVPFFLRRAAGVFRDRPGAPPLVANDGVLLREGVQHGTPTVTWVGHATVLVQMDHVSFLTDP